MFFSLGQAIGNTSAGSKYVYDADALAYATETSLPDPQALRLSAFLKQVKDSGVDLKLVMLGRSEFLSRTGATYRSVIGPDGTVTGTVGDTTDGMDFNANSANHLELDNPYPFTDDKIWQLVVVQPDALATTTDLISGANGNSGPVTRLETSGASAYRVTAGPAGVTVLSRTSINTNYSAGTWMIYGGQLALGNIMPIPGIYFTAESSTSSNAWNNETKWRIGEGLNGSNRLDGRVSLAMAGAGELTRQQLYRIASSMIRNQIATINPPEWLGFIGDSMTVSTAGGAGTGQLRHSVWCQSNSGWKGSFFDVRAVGGSPWTGASPTQREFFDTMMERMSWAPDMPRTIVFWGGYNVPGGTMDSQSLREAVADNYIQAATEAAAAGIKTVHWSMIVGNNASTPGSSYYDGVMAFNDYYKAGIEALAGQHIFYDHRDTFSAGEFDGATATAAYFGDQLHLTAAGIAALTADFLATYPDPSTAFS